jgi:hypothetical protein
VLVAGALHASQIIAVRSERLGGEDYVAAALIEVPKGREVREGRVRREGGKLPQLTRLAQFVLTGEGSPDPLPVAASSAPPPTGKPPKLWQGPLSYALLGAAAVLAGVAIYEQIHAGDLQRQMDALVVGGQVPSADYPKYLSLRSSATDARNARTGLAIGAGVVGLGGGAFLAWSLWPEPRAGTAGRSTLATGIAISGNF